MSSFKQHAEFKASQGDEIDKTTPSAMATVRSVPESNSNMIAPSVRVCLLLFLLMSCFVMLSKFFFSFWDGSSVPTYTSLLSPTTENRKGHWVDTWTAAPQSYEYRGSVSPPFTETDLAFENSTIRQTLQLTIGAEKIRLRLSNAFGLTDLPITNVTVALPKEENGQLLGSRSVDVETLRTVTFSGSEWVTIPDGALAVSDPISFDQPVKAGEVLTVTMYLREGQDSEYTTSHVISGTTSWMAFDDYTRSADVPLGIGHRLPRWFFISAVEAWKEVDSRAFAIVGDSITDGRGGRVNVNSKWPHLLFDRMQKQSGLGHISVVNQGAGGNQLLHDGIMGPNAASRIDRDVLAQSGIG